MTAPTLPPSGIARFITTEPLGPGLAGEQRVWDAVRAAYADRECMGYWRYPIFSPVGQMRREPDILLATPELGLVVIEVKSFGIDAIRGIQGHQWDVTGFNRPLHPWQQAELQLRALIGRCDLEPHLWRQVPGKALVALPFITEAQWRARGFDRLPSSPPLIFADQLGPIGLRRQIESAAPVVPGPTLAPAQWETLLATLGGGSVYRRGELAPELGGVLAQAASRAEVVERLRGWLYELDLQQAAVGQTIPPGPQRIRGIAGSGKTVLLCQRAAHMHLKHPDWDIGLVFFTRTLYDPICGWLDRWLRHFSNGEVGYRDATAKLHVMHAWGAREQPGFYRTMCRRSGVPFLTVSDVPEKSPARGLAYACRELVATGVVPASYDAILVDEGQDLAVADDVKYDDKQAIYWLAWQALRPADPEEPDMRRLIWAYDEAQSLDTLKIPSARELFGEGLAHVVSGFHKGGLRRSEVMHRCYRTPGPILTAAHAIGMGLMRPDGMLSGLTSREGWEAIGYEVDGQFLSGHTVTLRRPPDNSPNPTPSLWAAPVLAFESFGSRQEELAALAEAVRRNVREEGLAPSREVLVVVLGEAGEAIQLERAVAMALMAVGVDVFIPSALRPNDLEPRYPNSDPNRFWHEGAVTISRIHRAKGNEAEMVHVVGFDLVARQEDDISLRNQLFVGLTRARAWARLSGVGDSPLATEMRAVMAAGDTFGFTFRRPPRRDYGDA